MTDTSTEAVDRIGAAKHALLNYAQADMDGIIVTTSRQAIHEVVDALDAAIARAEAAEARVRSMADMVLASASVETPADLLDAARAALEATS